jgi:hypothetical protein
MIAYVFWHWKQPPIAAPDYERVQKGFHDALAKAPPAGFYWSQSFAMNGCTWAADKGDAYEDRYLVDDFTALDALDQAAVTASRQAPHDSAAALAAGGIAGIYELRQGEPMRVPRYAAWFSKPACVSYAALRDLLEPVVSRGEAAVWMRRMTLGPTPEFCLYSAGSLALPDPIVPLNVPLRPVYPG